MKFTIEYVDLNQKGGMINMWIWNNFFIGKDQKDYALFNSDDNYIGIAENEKEQVINNKKLIEIIEIKKDSNDKYTKLLNIYNVETNTYSLYND
jgi:hypothetical protein